MKMSKKCEEYEHFTTKFMHLPLLLNVIFRLKLNATGIFTLNNKYTFKILVIFLL